MTRSMTGFARAESQYDWGSLSWEIRSVNHRFLECNFRLPESVRFLETELRELARQQLFRGKLDCTLNLNTASSGKIQINLSRVQEVINAAEQIDGLLHDAAPLNALEFLRWPGVQEDSSVDEDSLQDACSDLFAEALEQLIAHRSREGTELQALIEQRLQAIENHVETVRDNLPEILQAQRDKLRDRLEELLDELDNDRLEQEMVILAQKADVDEELDRLLSHILEVRRTFKQKGAIGRRLDFLMQEFNREANTLGSKSISTLTTQVAVDLKVLIEQMREQIQNIE